MRCLCISFAVVKSSVTSFSFVDSSDSKIGREFEELELEMNLFANSLFAMLQDPFYFLALFQLCVMREWGIKMKEHIGLGLI